MSLKSDNARYLSFYNDKTRLVKQRLHKYLEKTDKDAVHQVRTAIRRLESLYSIFPLECRTFRSDYYLHLCREFFRHNSAARDLDVIVEKLQAQQDFDSKKLIRRLRKIRKSHLARAHKLGLRLLHRPRPRLKKTDASVEARLMRETHKRAARFLAARPVVLSGEASVEQVHNMRKQSKKLNYLLELNPALATPDLVTWLRAFQDIAGAIHDCDITLALINGHIPRYPESESYLQNLAANRADLLKQLQALLAPAQWEAMNKIGEVGE